LASDIQVLEVDLGRYMGWIRMTAQRKD